MEWIKFDQDSLPPDGSYVARVNISWRVDNPQYGKLVVLNGKSQSNCLASITHYAIDPGVRDVPDKTIIWKCSCGELNMMDVKVGSSQDTIKCPECGLAYKCEMSLTEYLETSPRVCEVF